MSDETGRVESPKDGDGTQGKRKHLKWIIPLAGLCVLLLALIVANISAGHSLDQRVKDLQEAIALYRTNHPAERTVLAGDAVSGNAVDDYIVLEWVLGPRHEWKENPPSGLPDTGFVTGDPKANQLNLTDLIKIRDLAPGEAVPEEARKLVERYGGLTKFIRQGLRKSRCDWAFPYEDGAWAPIPSLLVYQAGADLLEAEALNAQADRACEIGIEMVLFGRDLSRHPTLIGHMVGQAILRRGLATVVRHLERGPSRAATATCLSRLDRLQMPSVLDVFQVEQILMEATLAAVSGRSLGKTSFDDTSLQGVEGGVLSRLNLWLDREWGTLVSWHERQREVFRKPRAERAALQAEFAKEIEKSWSILTKIAWPSLDRIPDSFDEARVLRDCTRVLLAAHLHRLDKGAFPKTPAEVASYLDGSFPGDPFANEPSAALRLVEREAGLSCYSLWLNAVDDKGVFLPKDGDKTGPFDLGFSTRAP